MLRQLCYVNTRVKGTARSLILDLTLTYSSFSSAFNYQKLFLTAKFTRTNIANKLLQLSMADD